MRTPALVPPHVSLAEAARIAAKHGFVLKTVRHDGRLRIALVRPASADAATLPSPTDPPAPDAES
jgi:hypothetical protein